MKTEFVIAAIIISALAGGVIGGFAVNSIQPSQDKLIADFYAIENAVYISPHSLRVKMMKGNTNFTLVDLRSAEEYEVEHIAGAVNIPAYYDKETSAYDDTERIVSSFEALPKDKEVIVYCYSMPCMTGRKIGKMLADNGIYVKHLGVGWNEWRYFWTLWNHEFEWNQTDVMNYVSSGPEPGAPNVTYVPTSCGEGEFGC